MQQQISFKRLFRIVVLTSPFIGTMQVLPIYIVKAFPIALYALAFLILTFAVFILWVMNIFLLYLKDRKNYFRKFPIARYLISYAFSISLRLAIIFFVQPHVSILPSIDTRTNIASLIMVVIINTVILIILHLAVLQEKKSQVELENSNLKLINMQTQFQRLKQQIQPHFFFNAMTTLKSLIRLQPDIAEEYVVKLSDFLRTSLSSDQQNIVKLQDELNLCTDFLDMQKLRFNNALQFSIDIPEEIIAKGFVPVFSIQLLVENAIKHNALTDESPLKIKITSEDTRIIVSNNLQKRKTIEAVSGHGLVNLVERYRLLTNDEVIIKTSESNFSVSIKILENENSNYRG
jgi:two-component system LytT family sensor kinase